jgi:hypothetical protein
LINSPENIRHDTGWHKGADNRWRFEIDDSGARLINPPVAVSWEAYARKPEDDYLKKVGGGRRAIVATMTAKQFKEHQAFIAGLRKAYDATNKHARRLDELLDHPALFAAYPELKAYTVFFDGQLGKSAAFNPQLRAISIGDPSTIAAFKGVLLHEIQPVRLPASFEGGLIAPLFHLLRCW